MSFDQIQLTIELLKNCYEIYIFIHPCLKIIISKLKPKIIRLVQIRLITNNLPIFLVYQGGFMSLLLDYI